MEMAEAAASVREEETAAGVGTGGPSTGNDGTTRQDSQQHSQESTSVSSGRRGQRFISRTSQGRGRSCGWREHLKRGVKQ